MIRFPAREITVGNRPLGGLNPIRLQSMTNTDTRNVAATVGQIIRIFEAGADYVRVSVPNHESAAMLPRIRNEVNKAGFDLPLVADIHFNPDLALIAARHFEAVRINPGNYTGMPRKSQTEWSESEYQADLESLIRNLIPLVDACKNYGVALRIGTNFGSLSKRIISRLGNTPEAMAESTMEFLKAFESLSFYNTSVSLKASNPIITIRAYMLMAERMLQSNMAYPFHVGVTEAGEGEDGRIKSTLGISTLLGMGIGDTIRVSLSEAPETEIPVARKIAEPFQKAFTQPAANKEIFRLSGISFGGSTPVPALPMKHKAIVLSDSELDASDFSVAMQSLPEHEGYAGEGQIGMVVCKKTSARYPLWSWDCLEEKTKNYHPEWNFFRFHTGLDLKLMEHMLKISGPVILFRICTENPAKEVLPLLQQAAHAGINPAIVLQMLFDETDKETILLKATALAGPLLLQRKIQGLFLQAFHLPASENLTHLAFGLLQAAGLRITRNEYISCPTCSRTSFDLVSMSKKVKLATRHISGIKIAVMGCVVNGPGEMADADYGILGTTKGKVHLYKGSTPYKKNLSEDEALVELMHLIENEGVVNLLKNELRS